MRSRHPHEEYVPLSAATKRAMDLSVSGMRLVVGDRLYHSPGDPEDVEGERERPAITLPLWAFDQYIVTPEGETPPELTDPDLPNMGHKRFGQLREYRRSLDSLELVPGPTFTFCFWGVSRFCDVLQWQATGIPMFTPLDLNQYCGRPPLHFVLYTLTDKGETRAENLKLSLQEREETRHLQSRKTYFFRCGFWSSLRRPGSDVVRNFAGKSLDMLRGTTKARKSQQSNAGTSAGVVFSGLGAFVYNLYVTFMVVQLSPATSAFAGNFNKSAAILLSLVFLEGAAPWKTGSLRDFAKIGAREELT
eukprot:s127_g8.t1